MSYEAVGYTRAEMEARNKRERKEGRAVTRDWRSGAPMTKEKEKAQKRTAKTIENRAKAAAEAANAEAANAEAGDGGLGVSPILLIAGAGIVLLLVLKKRKKR